jgi:virulence factor Mce-like protein
VIKQAPSVGRILVMVAFALSCFGILMFLWLSFGGSVPLRPKGYEMHVKFPEATTLAQEADVRISGVTVGKVVQKVPDRKTGLTNATLQIDSRYAPVPANTRAILRQKTLLGETYVELTPGHNSPTLADGGTLPEGQVAKTVELDEIFRTFDPKTRAAFQTWMADQGSAINNQGESLNDALANLEPFAENTDAVLKVLRKQSGDTRSLVRDTGAVFSALSERQGQLRGLVTNSNRVFQTTARRNADLADAITVFPTFLRESRSTTLRLTRFANTTNPLITQLRPAARQISPTLIELAGLAPDLRGFLHNLGPLIRVSRTGIPATEGVLKDTEPFLGRIDPFLRQLNPILDYLGLYRQEVAAFFANSAASSQAVLGDNVHYLRTQQPLNPEVLAAYPHRLARTRSNPYPEPGAFSRLASGLSVFGSYLCGGAATPPLSASVLATQVGQLVNKLVYSGPGNVRDATPPCKAQRPGGQVIGQSGLYPRLQPQP